MKESLKFTINAGTYPFKIKVIICSDPNYSAKYINKIQHRKGKYKYDPTSFKKVHGLYCQNEKYCSIIWMPEKPKKAKRLSTVAHEILHGVFDCLDWFNIEYSKQSEEAFTYLHTHMMEQFIKKCGLGRLKTK